MGALVGGFAVHHYTRDHLICTKLLSMGPLRYMKKFHSISARSLLSIAKLLIVDSVRKSMGDLKTFRLRELAQQKKCVVNLYIFSEDVSHISLGGAPITPESWRLPASESASALYNGYSWILTILFEWPPVYRLALLRKKMTF
ncbi:hypothetical protein KIN20_018878 [Parelaphostrongylus tenuis]|uniref:Uncharacterized protein n=1 Tax=Parelaphostrongylus tenuis TaxID=148309 RepID=A0AAD5MK76_PARTN|nr:hypothetical protein KIN20_018878 [Parelaphostrongylus tenuis]